MNKNDKVVFVYNADAGLFSTVSDFAHKVISPDTYSCNLCKITYGNFTMEKDWKDFLNSLDCQKEFLHRNEFRQKYPQFKDVNLPCIFISDRGQMNPIVSAEEINSVRDIGALKNLLVQKEIS
jgi:hypothetical protein